MSTFDLSPDEAMILEILAKHVDGLVAADIHFSMALGVGKSLGESQRVCMNAMTVLHDRGFMEYKLVVEDGKMQPRTYRMTEKGYEALQEYRESLKNKILDSGRDR
ncbi:MAG: hypothetical protein WAZ18_04860 [Alphaproteobacteria bacterium]